MSKKIIIDAAFPSETRVVLLGNNNNIEDVEHETIAKTQYRGNIYLAKVTRIEPSLQAAFIDYGSEKSGFLPFIEIHPDYYHIPVSDQKVSGNDLKEVSPNQISSEEADESQSLVDIDEDDIDLKAMEELADEKPTLDLDLEIAENDVEPISTDQAPTPQMKNYKIQEVIKKGQILLVQVVKEERGNKGASCSTYITLAGKYCILIPNRASQNGVSRKILNAEERKRLKNIITQLTSEGGIISSSIIIRTAGIGRTTLEITRDYNYLAKLWNKIRDATLKSTAPCFIHQEEGIIQKTIRDMFDHNVKEMIVQGSTAYHSATKFMRDILPTEINRIKEYKSKTPIFTKFGIEEQLSNLYQPVVPLKSGGYIVINPTEALIAIDVNSGRAISERNIEETAVKTNLEAAKEISKQVRLRDLSGLLIIDFIDMYEARNRKIVERSMKEFLSRDRARIQTTNISVFGLMEVSRQRLRPSFLELNSVICSHCSGKGVVRGEEPNAMLILRTIENEISNTNLDIVNIYAHSQAIIFLLNNKRKETQYIEEKYNVKLNYYIDSAANSDSYSIEKIKTAKQSTNIDKLSKPALQDISDIYYEKSVSKHKQKWKQIAAIQPKLDVENIVDTEKKIIDSLEQVQEDALEAKEPLKIESESSQEIIPTLSPSKRYRRRQAASRRAKINRNNNIKEENNSSAM